ncbi:MAG: sulfurtransferase [Chloroflexi bacterium]|nr:sulfurtransferase [Chloroflexota bacterium]
MTLITADELAARLGDEDLRIADVRWYLAQPGRARREYQAGHIPGAIFVDLDTDLAAPVGPEGGGRHPLPDPAAFVERLGRLGIGSEHLVVAYDDVSGGMAARLWWMLDSLGHQRAALLDGGLSAWTAINGRLATDEPSFRQADLQLADRWRNVVTRDDLVQRLGDVALLDLRVGERYRGENEPVDPVAGHIPTARSAPLSENLDERGRFLGADALADRYRGFGAGERPVVLSCGSGVMACHGALAMRLAGLPDPLLYAGSYSDWSTAGLPVVTGHEPGSLPAALMPETRSTGQDPAPTP